MGVPSFPRIPPALAMAGAFLFALVVFLAGHAIAGGLGLDTMQTDVGIIATAAGILAGVPVAVVLAAWAERRAQAQTVHDRDAARHEVLDLLRKDLDETMDELAARDRAEAVGRVLRTDLWEVLSASGRLELVGDVELLSAMARAYHFIGTTATLERQLWLAATDPDQLARRRAIGGNPSAALLRPLVEGLREMDDHTKAAIDVALERLSKALDVPAPANRPLRPWPVRMPGAD